jgi:hypothetical protein
MLPARNESASMITTVLALGFLTVPTKAFGRSTASNPNPWPPHPSQLQTFSLFDMATGANARDNEQPAPDSGNAISVALHTQLSLVASFDAWLTQKIEVDGERGGIIARVRKRAGSYQQWLLGVEAAPDNATDDGEPWTMNVRARPSDDRGHRIVVTGPGSSAPVEIAVKDEKELEYLTGVCSLERGKNGWATDPACRTATWVI